MKADTVFFLIILSLGLQDLYGQERPSHWLIGQWEGEIERYLPKLDPARTLQIFDVLSDGKVRGRWSITGKGTGDADVRLEGAQIKIVTSAYSQVLLRRVEENTLHGTFTLKSGRQFSVKLTRSGRVQPFAEEWIALEREARQAESAGRWSRASTLHRQAASRARNYGQHQRAIDYGVKSLEMAAKANSPAQQIRAILGMVQTYERVGQNDKAREILEKGFGTLSVISEGEVKLGLEAQLYKELGWELIRKGEYEQAVKYLSRSVQRFRTEIDLLKKNPKVNRNTVDSRQQLMGRTLEYLGNAYGKIGNTEQALKAYEQGLEVVKDSGLSNSTGRIQSSIGELFSAQKDVPRAMESFQKALAWAENLKNAGATQRASSQIGNLLLLTNRPTEALPYLEKAIATIEPIRGGLEAEEFRGSYFDGVIRTYVNMIRAQLELNMPSEAFNYSERARSRAFLDVLGSKVQLARSGTLLEHERALQARISVLRAMIEEQENEVSETAELTKQVAETQQAYTDYLTEIRKDNKEQASLMNVEPLTLKEVQEHLDPGVTMLEYFVARDKVWLWVVEKDRVEFVSTSVAKSDLLSKVTALRDTIYQLREKDRFAVFSQELHKLLIEPALPHIKGKELIIVPHDVLHYLPFQALLGSDGQFLIEKYPIYYLSSASLMQFTQQKRRAMGNQVLAFGNPDLNDPEKDLEYADLEAQEIKSAYPQSAVYLKGDATEEKAKALSPNNDIIHFATHAELKEDDPLSSAILLAKSDKEDGRLEVREIFGMNLKADLVVLSGCDTGLGKPSTGDELVGLTRAFIYAGTPSVLASLWKIDDSSTAMLMASFYKNLKTMTKVESLRQAQLQLIRGEARSDLLARRGVGGVGKLGEVPAAKSLSQDTVSPPVSISTSHPYFWAPFILMGDGR